LRLNVCECGDYVEAGSPRQPCRLQNRDTGTAEIARIARDGNKTVQGSGGEDEKVWLGIGMMPLPARLGHQTPPENYLLG
jgi:hypothetical protein